MKQIRKKKGLSILLTMLLVVTSLWSTRMVAHAEDSIIVAPENMLNIQVVDKDGNKVSGIRASMLNEYGVECAAWNVNQNYKNSSSTLVERNGSGIKVGEYYYEPRSTFASLVAPGNLVYIRQQYGSSYSSFEGDVYFNLGQERELTLGYMPDQESAFQVPPNTLMINAEEKWKNACYDLYIAYGETEMIVNSMAGTLTGVTVPENCTMDIYGKSGVYSPQSYNMSFDKTTEYVKVRRKLSDLASRFNEDGTITHTPAGNPDMELTLEIASGTYMPGEVYFHIISGAVINYPVPDDEGYIEFYVEKKTGAYSILYGMRYSFITANGGTASGGGGGGIYSGYACEKLVKKFKAIDIPETGTTLYNVSAGNYTINLSNVPSRYMNPGPISVNVTSTQDIQELKIVLEDVHSHNFGTEYKKDATNHWKECACGEKSGEEAHVPGPAATEERAQTCTVCGYEIAPKLDHDFGTEYKKDATNHWKECACGEKSGVEAHIPGPEATEESAQTCTVCGYEIAPKLGHDFGTEYKKDATNHWKDCACGEKSGVDAHVP
ncbi:MAG: hypothetical protein IKJ39_07090, partial [Lachnospiraceae bacterium]|nr:hypothetical protein [Lachnospiraceae bacterium]